MKSHKDQRIEPYYLQFLFYIRTTFRRWIYRILYYYVDQSDSSLIVRQWSKNWDFVWHGLNFLLIFEFNRLLVTWETVDRLLLSMLDEFYMWAKINWLLKRQKNYTTICVENRTYVGNTKGKRALLTLNWGKTDKYCRLEPVGSPREIDTNGEEYTTYSLECKGIWGIIHTKHHS